MFSIILGQFIYFSLFTFVCIDELHKYDEVLLKK